MKRYYYIAFEAYNKKCSFWTYSYEPLMLTDALLQIAGNYNIEWKEVTIIYVQEITSDDYERATKMIDEAKKNL